MNAKTTIQNLESQYPGVWQRLKETITADNYFRLFKQLSDNYSPTLTVSRVQGPLVESLLSEMGVNAMSIRVVPSLRGSGSIGVVVGSEPAPIWLSGHADICSYLTGPKQDQGYALTPFCMHRAGPGRRSAVALAPPEAKGPLPHIAAGDMVTDEAGNIFFETDQASLPNWTRVVHHLPATWNRESDEIHGFIDNQGTCAALLLVAGLLSHFDVNVLLLLNDEEEGPVDKGNQGFSRAMQRLLHRTPHHQLPEVVCVSDVHQQESRLATGAPTLFGQGALYGGMASGARGAVTPPQLLAFTRELATELAGFGIQLSENDGYISRSDDISVMQYTPNVSLIGFAGTSAHFDQTPTARCDDLVHLSQTLAIYALIAQDPRWRRAYL